MADLRDYKNKDFSITVNSRMKGIELRFENTITDEQIEQIKEAGFRWSKRQQIWYAYQNEKTIAYAKSLESNYEANFENNEIKQEKAEYSEVEQTVQLQDLIAELREEIRKQNKKIKELEEIIEEKNNENEEILLEAENGEKMTIDEYNQWNEEQVLQEEIDDLQEGKNFISSLIQEESEIILTEDELEICKKIIPPNQYAYTLELTQGEEGDFYKQKLKDIAKIAMQITTDNELINEDGSHNVGFHYFVGNSDFYISEIKSDGTAFGYTILNGDVEMAEWGYQNIEEIINVSQWIEMDYHVPEGMTIERILEEKYPEYYKQENDVEIEQQSDVIVPREKIFSIFNKYISNEEYATEKANKFIKGWENKDFNSLAEGLVFKKDTTAELRKLFNEIEKVSLPEGNSNHLEVYTYLTKFADVETIPTEGKFNTWNDVIDYDIEVRTSLENKKNIFNFFQTHTSQTERTNYLKKEYSNGGGGVLPFNYVYTSDGIYLKALIDGKIKEKSYTWAEYTKFISDKISQGTYYTEPKIEKVTNKLIPSFNLLNEKYAIEFEPADEGKINVNSEADKWIVKFYDISKVIPGEIDKGRFIQKYYASSLLQNQNSTVGLNLGYGWSLDAETFNRAKEIIKDFVSIDMSENFSSKEHLQAKDLLQTSEPQTKKEIKNIREQCREILKKLDEEITEEDKLILAQYEGGGGIDEDSRTSAQVLNEFYTPNNLIEKVWNLVDVYNPNAVTVLEPTAGIGKFANNRPNNQFTMHELDETSARINKILHPKANVIQGAYQKQFLDEHERILNEDYVQPKYDIVIGNPPYGEYSGKYKNIEGKHHQRYEEYFIEKGLDALKNENSILAYVVPSGFLDSKNDKQKELIASKGQFVDAYRLPAGTFATTDVGTDILIMRSWEKVRKEFDKDFTNDGHLITKEEAFKSFQRGNAELLSNGEHFKDHPEKILGEIKQRTNQFGKLVDTVVHHEGLSIQDELNKIDDFVADIKKGNTYENHQESNIEIIEEELEELEVIEEVKEETPQKNKITTKIKEENQEKSLAPVMTSEEFSKLYGRDFKAEELPIWKATDWEGNIDTSKLSFQEENLLHESSNYVEIEPGKFTHRVLFESGDIGSKIEDYKAKIKVIQFNNEDSAERKIALYEKNIAELEKITPTKIPMERLHFGLNSTLSEEFMVEHINAEGEIVKLNLQESFILWAKGQTYAEVTDKNTYYWRGGIDFATANISQEDFPQSVSWYDIVEYIDKKTVKAERVTGTWNKEDDEIKADKAQARREAEEKRMARSETADKLFDKYLHEGLSEDLSKRVEAEYNRRFNSYVIPDYSKLPLFIDGMSRTKNSKKFKLYDQQIKGVSFLCNKGNGLLAYDVGVGKTAAGIVATVNQIQTGRSKRPVIVVPNAVYAKWYNDICELFPNIKVNDLYNLNKESTEKYRNKDNPHKLDIEENSISLITYEGLKNITFNDQSCENELFNDFSKLLSVDFDGSSRENAKNADNIKNAIGISSQVKNTNYVFFEDCGFDNITVDEAHNFKNLWTVPRPKNKGESNEFAGIPSGKPSARALKLFAMTQYTQRHNDDRNVFLLTATPFTNSPLEVYSMLSYVGRKRLIDSGLYSLRDFCNQFAHTKLELGVNSKGEIDQKQVMKDWKELPALQKILTEFIDKVDGEELKEIIRPKKFTHVQELEMSSLQKQMMEIDTQLMNEVKEGNSAAVIVSMNAMRVGLVAPALADPVRYPDLELPSMEKLVETSPKLKFVCDSVIDMYKNHPEKGQFIFMPLGQTAHGIVKDYLIAHGIPKETVEIINGSINNTTEKKDKLTQKFNNPKEKCKILIGGKNTSEGIDLNGNSFAMYNCSLGWNPSETIQAEGRIWRQGNQQGHVHCVYPVMNDSIDSLLYQKHDEKRSRINELWTYKDSDTLNIEDINPEDLKFDLIKDPQKRAKLILENGIDTDDFKFVGTKSIKNELNKVNNRIKSFDEVYEKRINLKKNLEEAEFNIQRIEKNIEDYKNADLETPEWCKAELKDNRKYKTNYEHQLETISRKFASWGIKDEKELEEFIPNLNKQKRTLEAELQAKEKELPKILKMEMLKLNEKKVLLPSISEQRKILTEDIQKNLRPMTEVEPEIRTELFEQMLNLKWERGEISADEAELYSSVGYKNYYAWLDGEIESLGVENIIEKQTEIVQEKTVDISTDKKVEEKQNESNSFSGELFSESELEELATINEKLNPQLKKHQVIYYYEDSGIDEGLDFMTLSEAQKEGKKSIKEWNLDKSENGFAIFNRETKQIEAIHGYFPVEKVFRNEILAINGYKVDESKQEVSLSEIQKSTKEKLAEQGASKEHFDSHVVFATRNEIKKEYADSYEW